MARQVDAAPAAVGQGRTAQKAIARRERLAVFGGTLSNKVGRRTVPGKVFNRRNTKPVVAPKKPAVEPVGETEAERLKREEEERRRRLWEDDDEGDDGDDGGGDDGGGDDGGDGDGDDGAGDS